MVYVFVFVYVYVYVCGIRIRICICIRIGIGIGICVCVCVCVYIAALIYTYDVSWFGLGVVCCCEVEGFHKLPVLNLNGINEKGPAGQTNDCKQIIVHFFDSKHVQLRHFAQFALFVFFWDRNLQRKRDRTNVFSLGTVNPQHFQ